MKSIVFPEYCQSALADLRITGVDCVIPLRQREDHAVYRIRTRKGDFVLKCYRTECPVKEIQVYRMLNKYGVATLPCEGMTENAILLLDLDSSQEWRIAGDSDMKSASTGAAVAEWYLCLHTLGLRIYNSGIENLDFLNAWIDVIQPHTLLEAGHALELNNFPGWQQAIAHCEALKANYQLYPQTFNYNDFAAENLALFTGPEKDFQAVVFDYDQFSIGTATSDWRNICYSLQDKALEAFVDAYGEVDENERKLDEVLSILDGLIVAAGREKFPNWALPLRESVENGELERRIELVLAIL